MLTCRQMTGLCSDEMDRPLALGEQLSLGTHLLVCRGCRNFRQQMQALRQVSAAYAGGRVAPAPPKAQASD
ncbi:MAG: zf-HC2 domain-containing protein [Ramlibacter sp.]